MLATFICAFLMSIIFASAGVTPQSHPVQVTMAIIVLLIFALLR